MYQKQCESIIEKTMWEISTINKPCNWFDMHTKPFLNYLSLFFGSGADVPV